MPINCRTEHELRLVFIFYVIAVRSWIDSLGDLRLFLMFVDFLTGPLVFEHCLLDNFKRRQPPKVFKSVAC